jgi:DNA-binding MarR family transcriptional regulator
MKLDTPKSLAYLTGKAHLLLRAHTQHYINREGLALPVDLSPVITALQEGGELCQQALAEMLLADRHKLSRMVDHLEILDWVERRRHQDGGREKFVVLTDKAHRQQEILERCILKAMYEATTGLSNLERRILTKGLVRIIDNLYCY